MITVNDVSHKMKLVADPEEIQHLLHGVANVTTRTALQSLHPGLMAAGL
jgi:hypothetical protein